MKTLMLDMDNVITNNNFTILLEEFLNTKLDFNKINVKYRQEVIEGKEEEFKEIYENHNLYENAPLLEDCFDVLQKLNEIYDIYIVTSYIWGKDIINPAENLKNKFNYLKEKLPFIDSKKYIFTQNKKMMHFDISIDDRLSGLENADLKILFNSWSNKNIEESELKEKKIIRVNNWKEIEKLLLEKNERKIERIVVNE